MTVVNASKNNIIDMKAARLLHIPMLSKNLVSGNNITEIKTANNSGMMMVLPIYNRNRINTTESNIKANLA
jgi:hypothetical protein